MATSTQTFTDVHTSHCCKFHGCKYHNEEECAVITGKAPQQYTCELCDWELEDHANFLQDLADLPDAVRIARRFNEGDEFFQRILDLPQTLKHIKEIEAIQQATSADLT